MKQPSPGWCLLLIWACLYELLSIQFCKAENSDDPDNTRSVLQQCCSSLDAGQLWDCVQKEMQNYSNALLRNKSDMVVITFATDNIAEYAAYSMAVMAAWAQQHGYPMRIYSPADAGDLFDTYDPRWNKVPAVRHALTQWAPQADAALWVDADLTVLDFSTTMQDFIHHSSLSSSSSKAPPPNIFVCAEHDGSSTYTNTGSFLAVNNPRTVELLELWWTIADRTLHSDQEALDLVLRQLRQPQQQSNQDVDTLSSRHSVAEVHVLPTSFFNSNPPAMTQLDPTDRALHLMGSTTPYRATVFGRAWEETCQAFHQGRPLAEQLGITQQFLLTTALSVHRMEYDQALGKIEQLLLDQPPKSGDSNVEEEHLFHLQRVALPLSHALIHTGDAEQAVKIDYQVRDAFVRVIHYLRSVGRRISPELLQKNIAQALKCMRHPRSNEPAWVVFDKITANLDELEAVVNPKQMASVVLMRASLEQHIVHFLIDMGKWEQALERQFGVLELLQRDDIMEHNQIKPSGTLANLLCQAKRYIEALPYFAKVIALQTGHFGESHPAVAVELLNRGICLYESGNYRDAMRDLARAKRIYQTNHFPPDHMELQRAIHFHRLANTATLKEDL